MRWSRDALGRDRIWYSIEEIEAIMDDETRKAGLVPTPDRPSLDLEPFLERHLGVLLDQYASLPADTLGQTTFEPGQPVHIDINADLTGALDERGGGLSTRGRWRATLAHEAAHVLLHRMLFEVPLAQPTLLESEPAAEGASKLMRCLKRDVSLSRTVSDWREVQANRGMAVLLMPRGLFTRVAREEQGSLALTSFPLADDSVDADRLTRRLAARFDVSRQAAAIRLRTLGLVAEPSAQTLGLPLEV